MEERIKSYLVKLSIIFSLALFSCAGPRTTVREDYREEEITTGVETSHRDRRHRRGPTPVSIESLGAAPGRDLSEIEIVWSVPPEAVDHYVIRYGFERDHLPSSRSLSPEKIARDYDPRHGEIYRYHLTNVPASKAVFLTLSAIRDGEESEPSAVFEIAAE